jgi:hypothetical protein
MGNFSTRIFTFWWELKSPTAIGASDFARKEKFFFLVAGLKQLGHFMYIYTQWKEEN